MENEAQRVPWYRSLVFKVALCASAGLVLATGVMTVIAYRVAHKSVRDGIYQRLRVAAVDRQRMISAYMAQQHEYAASVARRTELLTLINDHLAGHLAQEAMHQKARQMLAEVRRSSDGLVDIWICDADGKVITATNDTYLGRDFSDSIAFQIGSERQYLNDLHVLDDEHRAFLTAPAEANDGRLLGVVMILLDTTRLVELIADQTGMGETGEVLVAKREDGGRIRYLAPRRNDGRLRDNVSEVGAMDDAIAGASNLSGISTRFGGRDVLAVYQPITFKKHVNGNWGLVAKIDTAEAYLPVQRLAVTLSAAGVSLSILGVVATAWGAIGTFRPLRALTSTAMAISRGGLDTRAAVNSNDECGVLARTFNMMMDRLSEANANLETQVEERTAELAAILDAAADGIVTINEYGKIESVNPAIERIFGYSAEELLGHNVSILMPSPFREEHDEYLARYLRTGEKRTIDQRREAEGMRKDGTRFPLELKVTEVICGDRRLFTGCVCDISDRKQAVAALEESEARFQQIVEHLQDVLWMTNADGSEIVYVSPAYESIWGRSRDTLYDNPQDWVNGLHPDDRERVAEAFYQRAASCGYDETFRVVLTDGFVRWIRSTGSPIRNDEGDVYRIAGVARDITERKAFVLHLEEINQQLRAKAAFQRAVLNSVDYTVIITNRDGVIISFNKVAEHMFGYMADEIVGKYTPEILHDRDEIAAYARELTEELGCAVEPGPRTFIAKVLQGETVEREWTGIRKDGSRFPMLVSITTILDDHGEITGFLGVSQDITERKAIETELRSREQFARRVLDSLLCFAAVTDTDGILLECNKAALIATGLQPEDMIGTRLENLYSFSYDPNVKGQIRDAVRKAAAGQVSRLDVTGPVADGKVITVDFQIVPLRNEEGNITHLIPSAIDVTDRIRYEQQLRKAKEESEQANIAKSQFFAAMSHELRTPLNGVIGMTELLRNTTLDDRQRQFVSACYQSASSLMDLINDILDFSKIEAGKLRLDLHDFDLEKLVTDTVEGLAWRASDKSIEILCHIDQTSRYIVKGDSTRLRQIVVNLLGNAIKFTETGEIQVHTETVAKTNDQITVRFAISDTGIGIPPDKLDRLFQSFSQVDASTTRNYGGTGLGLVISQSLVELMGGTIGVESDEGVGSTFWFEVPFAVISESAHNPSSTCPLAGRRLLIVDDNETNRLILNQYSAEWGTIGVSAASVDEALSAVDEAEANGTPFDVVLTDYNMPRRNGLDLAHALKHHSQLIVLLMGSTDLQLEPNQLWEHGIAASLHKPVRRQDLYEAICCLLCNAREKPAPVDTSAAIQTSSLAGHILVAEDNRINQMYIIELLSQLGCTSDTVANGREAVDAVQQANYNLALMDCQMPEMDGFEATRRIRQLESERMLDGHLPIVALTANAVKGDRERCLDAGMDDYLAKPVEKQQIISVLDRFLSNSQQRLPQTEATVESVDQANDLSAPAPIDAESLLARCFGNLEFAGSLLDELESTGMRRVEEIRTQAAQQNSSATADAAHALKGAAGILCAEGVQKLAATIEQAGRSSNIGKVETELVDLEAEMQRCLGYVPELRKALNNEKESAGGGGSRC